MRHAGLIKLGRYDPDVAGQRASNFLDDLQPWRVDAVIIGAKYPQSAKSLSALESRLVKAPSYPLPREQANRQGAAKTDELLSPHLLLGSWRGH
jgi:hypothetical protein